MNDGGGCDIYRDRWSAVSDHFLHDRIEPYRYRIFLARSASMDVQTLCRVMTLQDLLTEASSQEMLRQKSMEIWSDVFDSLDADPERHVGIVSPLRIREVEKVQSGYRYLLLMDIVTCSEQVRKYFELTAPTDKQKELMGR